MWTSPLASTDRSSKPCRATWSSMCSRKGMAVLKLARPEPSRFSSTLICVSLVSRETLAFRLALLVFTDRPGQKGPLGYSERAAIGSAQARLLLRWRRRLGEAATERRLAAGYRLALGLLSLPRQCLACQRFASPWRPSC